MQIRVYEKVSQCPMGDRDTKLHPSSAFTVVLVNGDRRTTIFSNNQYDHWWTSIQGTREEYLQEAMKAAEDMAKTLGACEIVGVNLTKKEVRVEELENIIQKAQDELLALKREIM